MNPTMEKTLRIIGITLLIIIGLILIVLLVYPSDKTEGGKSLQAWCIQQGYTSSYLGGVYYQSRCEKTEGNTTYIHPVIISLDEINPSKRYHFMEKQ